MNKRFLALAMTVLLILTGAVPAGASTEDAAAASEALTESVGTVLSEEMLEDIMLPELTVEEESTAEETESGEEALPADESAPADESVPTDESVPADESAPADESLPADESSADDESLPADESTDESMTDESLEDESLKEEAEELEEEKEPEQVGAYSFTPKDPEDGKVYILHAAKDPNYVLDIYGCLYRNSAKIQLYRANGTDAQRFMFMKVSDGVYTLMNLATGKVFDAAGGSTRDCTQIQQYDSNGTPAQKWQFVKNANGTYTITSTANSTKVIDVAGGLMRNGRKIQLYTSNNSIAQQFLLEETTVPDLSGTIMMRPVSSENTAAAPAGLSTGNANLLTVKAEAGNDYQKFVIEKADYGFYTIRNKATGKVVDVAGGMRRAGTNVQLYTANGTDAQKWRVCKNSDGTYTFYPKIKSDLALTLGDAVSGGTNLCINARGLNDNQMFYVTEPEKIETTELSAWIVSALESDRVLHKSGNELVSNDQRLQAEQKIKIEPVHVDGVEDGYYVRLVSSDGKVVDIQNGQARNNQNVRFYDWNGTDAQLWHLVENSDGTYCISSKKNPRMNIDITDSSRDYAVNIQVFMNNGCSAQKWHLASMQITGATISASDHNTVTVTASGTPQESDDGKAYLFAVEPYIGALYGRTPIASGPLSSNVTITTGLNRTSSASILQKKLFVGIKQNGIYKIISNGFYITNPEAAASNTTSFPTPSRNTKKGIKLGITQYNEAVSLKCSHVLIDMPIETFVRYSGDATNYTYEGKTYTFYNINAYRGYLKEYKNRGIVVTGIFYLSDRSLTEFMEPEARAGANTTHRGEWPVIFGLNTRDSGRKKVEALYSCLAEQFTKDGILVANWVMGNESDQFICYNYSGEISYDLYHEAFAEQYRLFNAAIKSRWSNARCYISLDHNWNVSWNVNGTYQGMGLVSDFNNDLTRQGKVHWDMAMHPYPSPEQDCRIWNRNTYMVRDSGSTMQVTMLNAPAWASYLKLTYGSDVHICMTETGFSSIYNGTSQINEQAAAVAYGYYITEFCNNIDLYGIHRISDEAGETQGGWYLGIWGKPSQNVFTNMDTKNWQSATARYISLVKDSSGNSISSWSQVVSGFNGSRWNNLS